MLESYVPPKVAFIAHPVDIKIFRDYIHFLKPDKTYRDELLVKLFEWMPPYKIKDFTGLSSQDGNGINAAFYMVPFLPEMREIKVKRITEKIDQVLSLASAEGCSVAALGGFTSIVLQGQEADFSRKYNIKITSGNSFTAAIVVRSIEETAEKFGVDLKNSTVAVIGASGDIGSACMGYFCTRVKRLYAAARSIPSLSEVVARHAGYSTCETIITGDNREALDNSDICIFVTSAYTTLFTVDDFRPNTIVCDASAPLNVKTPVGRFRDDVFLYHGGIASIPYLIEIGFDIGLASPNTFYGCQLEGLVIAMHPELPCSWGRGNIQREKLNLFLKILDKHPEMSIAFSVGNHLYSNDEIAAYAKHWKEEKTIELLNA